MSRSKNDFLFFKKTLRSQTKSLKKCAFWIVIGMIVDILGHHHAQAASLTLEVPATFENFATYSGGIGQIRVLPGGEIAVAGGGPIRIYSKNLSGPRDITGGTMPFAAMPDGTFIATGDANHCLVRLSANGGRDTGFNSPAVSENDTLLFNAVAIQPDGKILVGCDGTFSRPHVFGGVTNGLFRLNADGSPDASFHLEAEDGAFTRSLYIYPNGQILASIVDVAEKLPFYTQGVARFMPDGSFDRTFAARVTSGGFECNSLAVQQDGKILVAGTFSKVDGVLRRGLARLNADGSLDSSFEPAGVVSGWGVAAQPDGRILVTSGEGVIRMFPDGRPDITFGGGLVTDTVVGFALDSTGRIYFSSGSELFQYSGQFRVNVPGATVPLVLERSSSLGGSWTSVKTLPASADGDYPDYGFPGTGNVFYRVRPQ